MPSVIIVVLISIFSVPVCVIFGVLNLNGKWMLKESNLKYVDLVAIVPGGIYSDLISNKVIEDMFYGYQDVDLKWIPRLNWTYYRNFTVSENLLKHDNINLVFEGLDTHANVYVNNQKVGETRNMFVRYSFDVKDQLKEGINTVEIHFQSPIEVAAFEAKKQSNLYDIPVMCPPIEYRGECHVNMIRKMQASFAWDWGPSFPSVGIWKDVYLESYNETVIRYIVSDVEEDCEQSSWVLNIDTYLANNRRGIVTGRIVSEVYLKHINMSQVNRFSIKPNKYDETVVTTRILIPKGWVNTWWPNGYGAHDLYSLKVTFRDENQFEESSKTIRIGFRTVELVQDNLGPGLSFYFKINGVPIFMKGTNEIPIDILPEKGQNKSTIRTLLTTARDSHMNMIRVWGGGVYESDYFYELADELGIFIWQDFMFACSMYPANEEFLRNVLDEVRHQVKRLRSHTCVAIFSGNNENEGALASGWWRQVVDNFTLYKEDYIKLYVDTIKTEFTRLTHNRSIFITSSPTNGKYSDTQGYVSKDPLPSSHLYGDVHFYNYVADSLDPNIYPIPRFASEYGYQSLPSIDTLLTATNNISDLDFGGRFLDHRQHHFGGYIQMLVLIGYNFRLPHSNSTHYNEAYIYYSQIVQAMSVKIETEHYRSYRSMLLENGEGITMGALYWQLNDVWVAPTWSGIDYRGRWKMMQYFTQDFFAPVIITGNINTESEVELYVVTDLLLPLFNISAVIQLYKWTSSTPVAKEVIKIDVNSSCSKLITTIDVDNYLVQKNCGSLSEAKSNCFFYLSLEKGGVKITPDNFIVPTSIKNSNAQPADVQITSISKISHDETYKVEITTNSIALFVWLESHEIRGTFSENGFLQIDKKRNLYFYSDVVTSSHLLLKTLTVTNLLDKKYTSGI